MVLPAHDGDVERLAREYEAIARKYRNRVVRLDATKMDARKRWAAKVRLVKQEAYWSNAAAVLREIGVPSRHRVKEG